MVSPATATIGGIAAEVAYAGPATPANGVAQFNLADPRALAGRGSVEVVLTVNGQPSNAVNVAIRLSVVNRRSRCRCASDPMPKITT